MADNDHPPVAFGNETGRLNGIGYLVIHDGVPRMAQTLEDARRGANASTVHLEPSYMVYIKDKNDKMIRIDYTLPLPNLLIIG